MKNVKIGDVVVATGIGEFFTQISGGIGKGIVVHVQNPEAHTEDPEVLALEFPEEFLNHGILYKDYGDNDIKWLAPDDFEIEEKA